jgi:hypothetical protein
MSVDLDKIGAAVIASTPSEVAQMPDPETVIFEPEPIEVDEAGAIITPAVSQLLTLEEFQVLYWSMGHTVFSGIMSARMGAKINLSEPAMNDQGLSACKAMFDLINSQPRIANWILNTNGGFLLQMAPLIAHGAACVGVIRAAQVQAVQNEKDGDDD